MWLDWVISPAVKAKEMWVTVSLPHPFLERPKVRLTSHSYAVMSLSEDEHIKSLYSTMHRPNWPDSAIDIN